MLYRNWIAGMALALACLSAAGSALADIPPPGLCQSQEAGEACDEPVDSAGEPLSGAGICVAEQCKRTTPDGPMTYACNMCRADDDKPAPNPTKPDGEDDDGGGGCSIGGSPTNSASLAGAALALVLGLTLRRRHARARG